MIVDVHHLSARWTGSGVRFSKTDAGTTEQEFGEDAANPVSGPSFAVVGRKASTPSPLVGHTRRLIGRLLNPFSGNPGSADACDFVVAVRDSHQSIVFNLTANAD